MNLTLVSVGVAAPEALDSAIAAIKQQRVDALYVSLAEFFWSRRLRIVDFAARQRPPAMYWNRIFAETGGLMSYGADWTDLYRRAPAFLDKILKGAKPDDLPIERPTKFELIVNLKTAKTLGLTIPPSVLGRADEVIQ